MDCGAQIVKAEGVASLFKGAGANILRGVAGAAVLSMYDALQELVFGKVVSRYSLVAAANELALTTSTPAVLWRIRLKSLLIATNPSPLSLSHPHDVISVSIPSELSFPVDRQLQRHVNQTFVSESERDTFDVVVLSPCVPPVHDRGVRGPVG